MDLKGGLYSSRTAQEKLIKVFMQLHQCYRCKKYFTELKNLGSWQCEARYHPGKFDYNKMAYTCCGEKRLENRGDFHTADRFMTWEKRERLMIPPILSTGCQRCDCITRGKNPVPSDEVNVHQIASLIPAMEKYGVKLKNRPGFCRAQDIKKMKLTRREKLPKQCYACEDWD